MDGFAPQHDTTGEPAGAASYQRDAVRDSMFIQARLRPLDGADPGPFDVRVRNLSAGGLMAESAAAVAAGDRITVELRNIGEVGGRVAWVGDGRFGVSFDSPVDPKLARKPVKATAQPVITGSGYHRITHPLG